MRRPLHALIAIAMTACNTARFSGHTQEHAAASPLPTASERPSPSASEPPPAPAHSPSTVPSACQNAAEIGINDPGSNKVFQLLTEPKSYDDGVKACADLAQGGVMIFMDQNLPDALLTCRKVLGTLWMRRSETSLWQPDLNGERDASELHWIICYFPSSP